MTEDSFEIPASTPSVGTIGVLKSSALKNELLIALGRVTVSWAQLDYTLRLFLKRLVGAAWAMPEGDDIEGLPHKQLISSLSHQIDKRVHEWPEAGRLTTLVRSIGVTRHEGLYGERNELAHAAWFELADGEVVAYRPSSVRGPLGADASLHQMRVLDQRLESLARELKLLLESRFPQTGSR